MLIRLGYEMVFEAPVTAPEGREAGTGLDEPLEAEDLAVDWLEQETEPAPDPAEGQEGAKAGG